MFDGKEIPLLDYIRLAMRSSPQGAAALAVLGLQSWAFVLNNRIRLRTEPRMICNGFMRYESNMIHIRRKIRREDLRSLRSGR